MVTALHNRENCGTGFSRKLQLVLVVNLASGVFGLFIFHRFEDWTAQHQADKLPKTLQNIGVHYELPEIRLERKKTLKTSV